MYNWTVKEKQLKEMTEGELGKLWDIEPGKADLNKYIKELPNYEEPGVGKNNDYASVCWSCHQDIQLTDETKCEECNFAVRCSYGMCVCDKPGYEHLRKNKGALVSSHKKSKKVYGGSLSEQRLMREHNNNN